MLLARLRADQESARERGLHDPAVRIDIDGLPNIAGASNSSALAVFKRHKRTILVTIVNCHNSRGLLTVGARACQTI